MKKAKKNTILVYLKPREWKEVGRKPLGLKWSPEHSRGKVPVCWMTWEITEASKEAPQHPDEPSMTFRTRVELGRPLYLEEHPELWTAWKVFCCVAPVLEEAAIKEGKR